MYILTGRSTNTILDHRKSFINKTRAEAGERSAVTNCAALQRTCVQFPGTHFGQLTLASTPVAGDPIPSSGLHGHLRTCVHIQKNKTNKKTPKTTKKPRAKTLIN